MSTNALTKIRLETKRIMKKTGKSFRSAQKEAGKLYREGKIGGRRKKSHRVSGRKKSRSTKSRSHSRHHHSSRMSGMQKPSVNASVEKARDELHSELGWLLATQKTARTEREKKALAPKIRDLTRRLKALEK